MSALRRLIHGSTPSAKLGLSSLYGCAVPFHRNTFHPNCPQMQEENEHVHPRRDSSFGMNSVICVQLLHDSEYHLSF